MAALGAFRFPLVASSPPPPPSGYALLYIKTDEVLYLQDESGTETALGSASAITALTGEATATGPGSAVITLSNSAVIGKVLTGFTPGPNSTVLATDSIIQAIQKLQAQASASSSSAITQLTGDVSATGPGSVAATVNSVGGSSSANIHSAELIANSATTAATPNTVVLRDGSGNIAAANLSGSSSGTNTGDVTVSDTNSVDLSIAGQNLSADLKLSSDAADAGNVKATTTIHSGAGAGLHVELPFGTPVQIGTSNNPGSAASFSLSDHIHAITIGIIGNLILTGYVIGTNTAIAATDTIFQAFGKLQAQINATVGAAITSLTGDITATGPGAAASTIAVGAVTDTKASLANKPAITVVATSNQALTGTPVIDGQATTAGTSTVLLTAQTTASQNGPWVVQSGSWTRPTWYPSGGTTQAFQFITTLIRLGTTYQGSTWRMTTAGAITIDTTNTAWVVTPQAGNYRSDYTIGPQTGASSVSLAFANAFKAILSWNPTANFTLTMPPTQGASGTYLSNDGSGNLTWTNPLVNIDGGTANSVYTPTQFINGGTP